MNTYIFSLSTNFPNNLLAPRQLMVEIQSQITITKTCLGISRIGDEVSIMFEDVLSTDEQVVLTTIVAAHQGVEYRYIFHASSTLVGPATTITESSWQELGGAVSNPAFFTSDVANCRGRISFMYKTTGTSSDLRIVEKGSSIPDLVLNSQIYQLPDTLGEWKIGRFWTDIPPRGGGDVVYVLEGQLNGATNASIKFCSLSLLERTTN